MNYLEKNKESFIEDLKGLIKIKSYLTNPENYPTPELISALDYMINLAKREGFKYFKDEDNHYCYIEIGEGKELIGILGHLDVVPPGQDLSRWENDPFELKVDGDLLKGRGTQDDKGPVMQQFYLLKKLAESKKKLTKRIRLILPTDEESFWRGVDKYKSDGQEIPTYGYTADAFFPVVYSERELWEFRLKGKPSTKFTLKAGEALNVVPDEVEYVNSKGEIHKEFGKAAHAMEPQEGENAIVKIIPSISEKNQLIDFIKNEVKNETNGQTLFNKLFVDDNNLEMSVNLAVVNINEEKGEILFDLRIPNSTNSKELKEILLEKIKNNYSDLEFEEYDWLTGVYIKKDSFIMKNLIESYQSVTKDLISEPTATGGATYARSMPNIVAFGPYFKDTPQTEHQYNEYSRLSDFIKSFDIYEEFFKKIL
ncbi:MAG: hypothetical protein TYPL_3700 [Candidatus Tyloplasma litorale]|nr:MAG: hypothetical protein TYPL_3700 [Mycoplasmatales bacterium]